MTKEELTKKIEELNVSEKTKKIVTNKEIKVVNNALDILSLEKIKFIYDDTAVLMCDTMQFNPQGDIVFLFVKNIYIGCCFVDKISSISIG